MRLPNGFGTCYRLTGSRRKPYRAAVCTGEKENGQLIYKTIGYFKHKQEGIAALKDYHEYPSDKKDITLAALFDEWSISKYKYISAATVDTYNAAYKHLAPISAYKYQVIRSTHYQQIIDGLNLSRSSLHKIKTLSVQLGDYAAQNDIATKNYAKFIKLPKWIKAEKDIFTDAEIKKMKKQKNDKWIKTVLVLIYTGMRIGEMISLTVFQIDIDRGTITTGSKTEAGQRVIPIHKTIKPFIGELPGILEDISVDKYRKKYYYPALEAAKVRRLSPHSCRHTFASILARENVDILSIQKLMGHADYSLTANVYSHPEIEQLRKAVDKL